jgi:hypothetical protein
MLLFLRKNLAKKLNKCIVGVFPDAEHYSLLAFVSTHAVASPTISFLISVLLFNALSWLKWEQMQLMLDVLSRDAYVIVTTSSSMTSNLISFFNAVTTTSVQAS